MSRQKKESEKIQVSFNKEQIEIIRSFKGILGTDDAEIVRGIVTNWLLERKSPKKEANR